MFIFSSKLTNSLCRRSEKTACSRATPPVFFESMFSSVRPPLREFSTGCSQGARPPVVFECAAGLRVVSGCAAGARLSRFRALRSRDRRQEPVSTKPAELTANWNGSSSVPLALDGLLDLKPALVSGRHNPPHKLVLSMDGEIQQPSHAEIEGEHVLFLQIHDA